MKKLIKLELQKMMPSQTIKAMMLIFAILYGLVILFAGNFNFKMQSTGLDINNLYRFPHIWNTLTNFAEFFNVFPAIAIVSLIGTEFTYRTFRQNIIDGLTRNEIVTGKIILGLMISIACTLFVFVITLIYGIITTPNLGLGLIFQNSYQILAYFLQVNAMVFLAMMLAFLLRNTAITILIFLVYCYPIDRILRNTFSSIIDERMLFFFPMKSIAELTQWPTFQAAFGEGGIANTLQEMNKQPSVWLYVINTLVYCGIFILLTFLSIRKKNL